MRALLILVLAAQAACASQPIRTYRIRPSQAQLEWAEAVVDRTAGSGHDRDDWCESYGLEDHTSPRVDDACEIIQAETDYQEGTL